MSEKTKDELLEEFSRLLPGAPSDPIFLENARLQVRCTEDIEQALSTRRGAITNVVNSANQLHETIATMTTAVISGVRSDRSHRKPVNTGQSRRLSSYSTENRCNTTVVLKSGSYGT
jgi:hypothetical protein